MCEFISWIEKDGNIYYLTYRDIYHTRRGKELRDYCKNKDDYIGHGAIRYFYDSFEGGTEKECTDFSTPKNFPDIIVEAIKNNAMSFLATIPVDLLKKKVLIGITADAEWEKVYAEWEKADVQKKAWKLFRIKENRNPLWR